MKMNFKLASPENAQKNVKHIDYIAKRKGVDKVAEVDGKKLNHIEHGLFNENGVANIKQVKQELSKYEGTVYRTIISLREKDALLNQLTDRKDWESIIKNVMPTIQNTMNLKNMKWVAALHNEQGHPHLHVTFWEEKPHRRIAKLTPYERKTIHSDITKQFFQHLRLQKLQEKTALRDYIREKSVTTFTEVKEVIRTFRKFDKAGDYNVQLDDSELLKIQRDPHVLEQKKFEEYIISTMKLLPGDGRVAYGYLIAEKKQMMDKIVEKLFQEPEFKYQHDQYKKIINDLAELKGIKVIENLIDPNHKKEDVEDYRKFFFTQMEDLTQRTANVMLKAALQLKKEIKLDGQEIYQSFKKDKAERNKDFDETLKNNEGKINQQNQPLISNLASNMFKSLLNNVDHEKHKQMVKGNILRNSQNKRTTAKQIAQIERRVENMFER